MKKLLLLFVSLLLLTSCYSYDGETYTVTFETNGGSEMVPVTVTEGFLKTFNQPTKEGYIFSGWYLDSELTEKHSSITAISEDTTLYAKWEMVEYALTFLDEDGTILQTTQYAYGEDLTSVTYPSVTAKTGYTFTGWDSMLPDTMPDEAVTLTAQYEHNLYTIEFIDYDGTVLMTTPYYYEHDLSNIQTPTPSRDGYTFTGWDNVLPSTMPTENITLQATYSINTYSLIYVDYDDTVLYLEEFVFNTLLDSVSVSDPERFGYHFTSWSEELPDTMPGYDYIITAQYEANMHSLLFLDYDLSTIEELPVGYYTELTDVSIPIPTREGYTFTGWDVAFPKHMPDNDLTYTATYEINTHTVEYIDYDGNVLYSESFDYGDDLTLVSISNPTRIGYTFTGWDTTLPNTVPDYDITVTAEYTINSYTISFLDYDGTLIHEESFDYNTDSSIVYQPYPTRDGYEFHSWDQVIPTTMPSQDVSLTALYDLVTYQIIYELHQGTNASNPSSFTVESETITFLDPERTGYTFIGWYDNEEYTGSQVTELPSGTFGEQYLIAKWTPITYNITYTLNGGTASLNPSTYTITSDDILLTNPTKTGYTFMGWYESETFEGFAVDTIFTGTTGDIVLYAKWDINQHDITYITFDDYNPSTDILLSYPEELIALSYGSDHSLALSSTGRVFGWGFNLYGQLTNTALGIEIQTPTDITSAFPLTEGETIVSITTGYNSSAVLTSNGRVFTFGNNEDGQLGDGTNTYQPAPVDITSNFNLSEGETIISITLGGNFSSALSSNGRVFTWGNNNEGQLGNGTNINSNLPVDITSQFSLQPGETVVSTALGYKHILAFTSQNRLFGWGYNSYGQVGNGIVTAQSTPVDITSGIYFSDGEDIQAISAGNAHSALITTFGAIYTWGYNLYGQLGDGTTTFKNTPTNITLQFQFELEFNETINAVSLTDNSTLVTTSNGRVYSWGYNNKGQVGDGTNYNRPTPVEITSYFNLLEGDFISFITSGCNHNGAITTSGKIYSWGKNTSYQLGDGTNSTSSTPILLPFIGIYDSTTFTFNYDTTVTPYSPTRTGYSLDSWYTDEELLIPYTFSTMPDESLILYGKWSKIE